MATDLPKRPEPDRDEYRIVKATDRVKSVADKTDPRFEAARARADKEAEIRARQEAKTKSAGDPEDDGGTDRPTSEHGEPDEQAEQDAEDGKGSFSFNLTAGDAKDEQ